MRCFAASIALTMLIALSQPAGAQLDENRRRAEEILEELIGFRSSALHPDQIAAAVEAMQRRLLDAGFPTEDVQLVSPDGDKASLVVRYRGSGSQPPLLLMAHIDVVDAEPEAWAFPPFELGNDGDYYYGRGTVDNKVGCATLVANFIRLRQEGFVPDRDLIMVLTGDEETDGAHIDWLANQRRDLIDAELALNTDAGGGTYDDNGEPVAFFVQTSEKIYQSFELRTTNPGGHSSVPGPDNAIYQLAAALGRIAEHRFPIQLNDGTRVSLERSAASEPDEEYAQDKRHTAAGDMEAAERLAAHSDWDNAQLRTTCVATRVAAGHADNALPRSAAAIVNCRILPTQTPDEIEAALREVVDDDAVLFRRVEDSRPSPPSP